MKARDAELVEVSDQRQARRMGEVGDPASRDLGRNGDRHRRLADRCAVDVKRRLPSQTTIGVTAPSIATIAPLM